MTKPSPIIRSVHQMQEAAVRRQLLKACQFVFFSQLPQ
uniref:Uncharacterized protein n=1 Tax=Arundo donax TaxID=35708 RepID=A0A0A8YR67_ARUDO